MTSLHYNFSIASKIQKNKKIWYVFENLNMHCACYYCKEKEPSFYLKYSKKNKKIITEDISYHNHLINFIGFVGKFFCLNCVKQYTKMPVKFTEEMLFKHKLGLI
jgi:hypothetical protein